MRYFVDVFISGFFREASLMLSIKPHLNVVRSHGMCQELGNFSMVMEFLDGGSLDGWVAANGVDSSQQIEEGQLYKLARGIAVGMRHLAAENIVHRDVRQKCCGFLFVYLVPSCLRVYFS